MNSDMPVRALLPHRKQIRRAWTAGAIILVAAASIGIGMAGKIHRSRAGNDWQIRMVRGEPVMVRFICGTDPVVDCNVSVKVTYEKQQAKWCETLERSDQDEISRARWCDANPERGTLNLFGVSHSFDRHGVVRKEGRLVGQLFLPKAI